MIKLLIILAVLVLSALRLFDVIDLAWKWILCPFWGSILIALIWATLKELGRKMAKALNW